MSQKETAHRRTATIFDQEHLRKGEAVPITYVIPKHMKKDRGGVGIARIRRFFEDHPGVTLANTVMLGGLAVTGSYLLVKKSEYPSRAQQVGNIQRNFGSYASQINGTYRELQVGDTKHGIYFGNLDSMASYVNEVNPSVDTDTALGVMELSVIEDDMANGEKPKNIDPTLVRPAQGIRIPESWGVGKLVHEDKTNSGKG